MQPGHPAQHASTPLHHLSCPCLSAGLAKGGKLKREKTQREETQSTLHRVLSFPGLWARKELRCPLAEFCWMNRSRVHTHTLHAQGGRKPPKHPSCFLSLFLSPTRCVPAKTLQNQQQCPASRSSRRYGHRGCTEDVPSPPRMLSLRARHFKEPLSTSYGFIWEPCESQPRAASPCSCRCSADPAVS